MTVPEQGKDSLNPKYVEKLVEARLYAISDKKHKRRGHHHFLLPRVLA